MKTHTLCLSAQSLCMYRLKILACRMGLLRIVEILSCKELKTTETGIVRIQSSVMVAVAL